MKAALSIVLAGLLVTTQLKQVFAQAAQQDSTTAEALLVQEPETSHLIRVPTPTATTALLWQPALKDHSFTDSLLSHRAVPGNQSNDSSEGFEVIVWVLLVAALVVGLYLLVNNFRFPLLT